jgi:trigger factor
MKVKVEKAGPCRKILNVELPAETVAGEFAQVVDAWAAAAALPGFRKGKAPRALVEAHYAKDIEEEVKERLIGSSYRTALKQEALDPVAILDLEAKLVKGKPLTYKVTLDVPPEFKLPKYKGLALKAENMEVTEAMVQQRLDQLLDQMAKYEPVTGRPVRKSDLAQVDYEGTCDGRPLGGGDPKTAGLGQGKDFWVMADENAFLPGFDTGLLGMAVGEQREISVPFPADFKVKAVAGRTALYRVTLQAIREKKLPALDAALLKEFQVETETALRAKIREALQEEARLREKSRMKDEICRTLLSKTDLDLPESLVQEEIQRVFTSVVRENLVRGVAREKIAEQREQLRTAAEKSARDKVKLGYILHRVAEEEKVAVTDVEVEAEIGRLAARYRMPADELRKILEEKNELKGLQLELRLNKTLDLILEHVKVGEEEGFFKRLISR